MNAAKRVISKFGGPAELARLLGKGQSTVSYWTKTGVIPAKWQPVLLELASQRSIDLSAQDFIATESDAEAEAEAGTSGDFPIATHWGELPIGGALIPCYRLDNDQRVFSLKGVIVALMDSEQDRKSVV